MLVRLILAFLVIVGLCYALMHYRKQTPEQRKKILWKYISVAVLGIVLLLIALGRAHWITGILAGSVVILQRSLPLLFKFLPLLMHRYQQRKSATVKPGNSSSVNTQYLVLTLDHDSGDINGEIVSGLYAGKKLDQLTREQGVELLGYYQQHDEESWQLLTAFMRRKYGDDAFAESHNADSPASSGAMNRSEALQILGLTEAATEKDIATAHKKLMQKIHPDRGGSTYLAAKVNQAKDFLLK